MSRFSCCFGNVVSSPQNVNKELLDFETSRFYKYKDLQIATEDFKAENKIGFGGFGSVYKGTLKDGLVVAIKVLSADSRQGLREFLNEIIVISNIQHENLVKLHGSCVEGDHRILVYGYLKKGSLDQTLLRNDNSKVEFTWKIRKKICIGVAKGLVYLHEEVQPHVIHRDIKPSNILLDEDYTPKISDFGLAKLFPSHLTHVSTRIAGTLGYLAPEYAIRGQLTRKADIYSFGVLLLEIVTGRPNQNRRLPEEEQYLLETLWKLYREGELERLLDNSIEKEDIKEACRYIKIGLLCTQSLPQSRPSMSNVLKMLQNVMVVNEKDLSDPGLLSELMNFKTVKNSTSDSSSSISGKNKDFSLYEHSTTSFATTTFTTISDR